MKIKNKLSLTLLKKNFNLFVKRLETISHKILPIKTENPSEIQWQLRLKITVYAIFFRIS